jgi:Ser/Thr protein kinase RdoA (MazF antagonist)
MDASRTSYSSPSLSSIRTTLEDNYKLEVSEIVLLKRGFNDTYRVTASGTRFIVRLYRCKRRTEAQIRSELSWLCYLNDHKLPVAFPLSDKKGEHLQPFIAPEGMRYLALFTYVNGNIQRKPDLLQCKTAGEALAKIHLVSKDFNSGPFRWDYSPEQIISFARNQVEVALQPFPEDLNYLDTLGRSIQERLKGVELHAGLCHGDLQSENFYYQEDGSVNFIDFDFAGYGPLLYDLGAYTWYDHKAKTPAMLDSFYQGYSSQIHLDKQEIELIPLFGMLRALFLMGMWRQFMDGESNSEWPPLQIHQFVQKLKTWSIK